MACGPIWGAAAQLWLLQQPAAAEEFLRLSRAGHQRQHHAPTGRSDAQRRGGFCLQRHEWFKHGTCQTEWDADGYFEVAIDLVKQFNASGVGPFIATNRGLSISTQDLFAVIDQGLGANAHKRMKFFCTNGQLVDIYMNLPDSIPRQQPKLGPLLQAAKEGFSSSCGESFRVDVM